MTGWRFAFFGLMFCVTSVLVQAQDADSLVSNNALIDTLVNQNTSVSLDYVDVVIPQIEERVTNEHPWLFFVGVLVLLLIGLIRAIAYPQHLLSIQVVFSDIQSQYDQLDKEASINPIIWLQIFVSSLIVALTLFVLKPFDFNFTLGHNLRWFLLLLLGVCFVYIIKYFIHYIVGVVLQSESLAKLSVIGLSSTFYVFSLLLFPLTIVWTYAQDLEIKNALWIAMLVLTTVFVLWRLIKTIIIYNKYFPFAKVYIIIYLCALEITPLLVMGALMK